ncbi:MAG: UDP-3-O-(3-hydroxymyristoyl)glucosamine N-acyltransferase [Deltaproteobacteria bacterium]|nr:UDP-3-O-(3-hydroxymyristoyl)glucosamine N-acyltransferase [Deltaproteobacteria bacterium]
MKAADLAKALQVRFVGNGELEIRGVASLNSAKEDDLVFVVHEGYVEKLKLTRAKAVLVPEGFDCSPFPHKTFLISPNPQLSLAKALILFYPPRKHFTGISEMAYVDSNVKCDEDVGIAPFVYVARNVHIGRGTQIFPFAYVGSDVDIGEDCLIYPHVVIMEGARIGNRVILQPGVVVGGDGFGYAERGDGSREKIIQVGRVVIEDEVEIGANTTIDRATFDETLVKEGTKIDNLVQVAHNVEIGENSVIVAQAGIAGSTKIGKNVILAGQVGVVGHVRIADGVVVGAKSGVPGDIRKRGMYSGIPVIEHRKWLKNVAMVNRLHQFYEKMKLIERRLEDLEEKLR